MIDFISLTLAAASSDAITTLWSGEAVTALVTLTILEVVLGIDNVVFISVLAGKLPTALQRLARNVGLSLAMVMRVLLLLSISWIMSLTAPVPGMNAVSVWFVADDNVFTWKDLILLSGGLFLIYKSVSEIHEKLEGVEHESGDKGKATFGGVILQILLLDLVFSLDSVITAVGMVQTETGSRAAGLTVMITAVIVAVGVMLFAAGAINHFVNRHPTIKMLALSFLILIGVVLVAESTHRHISKGYIYFAMGFSVVVELLNLRVRSGRRAIGLKEPMVDPRTLGTV